MVSPPPFPKIQNSIKKEWIGYIEYIATMQWTSFITDVHALCKKKKIEQKYPRLEILKTEKIDFLKLQKVKFQYMHTV